MENTLEDLLENLSEALDKMINTYRDILHTAQEKKDHIISGDIQLFVPRIDRFLPIATGAKLYIV